MRAVRYRTELSCSAASSLPVSLFLRESDSLISKFEDDGEERKKERQIKELRAVDENKKRRAKKKIAPKRSRQTNYFWRTEIEGVEIYREIMSYAPLILLLRVGKGKSSRLPGSRVHFSLSSRSEDVFNEFGRKQAMKSLRSEINDRGILAESRRV